MKLGAHQIVVLRAAATLSDYGNRMQLDWDDVTELPVDGCSVQPAPTSEFTVDRDSMTTRLLVYAPADADIEAVDRVRWAGEIYDVDGDVLLWDFGALRYLVVNLRRSEDA